MKTKLFTLLCACMLGIGPAHAASITWTEGSYFEGGNNQNNISLEGTLVRAVNIGGNLGDLDVFVNNGTKSETITFVDNNDLFSGGAFGVASPNTSDANWNNVIYRADYNSGTPHSFNLTGLAIGQEYQVELFVEDARSAATGERTYSFDDGAGNSSVTNRQDSWVSVIGTFTADATTQTIRLNQSANAPTMNAYVLRALGTVQAQLLLTPSDELSFFLDTGATQATGTVAMAFEYGSANADVEVTSASVIDQQYSNTFSVVGFTPLTLTDPAVSETLNVEFDVSSTNLPAGTTATGIVEVVWNEVGGNSRTNTLPVSVLVRGDGVAWAPGLIFKGGSSQNNISLEGTLIRAVNLGGNAGDLDVFVDNGTKSETITFVDDNDLFGASAYDTFSPETGDANWNAIITRADFAFGTEFPFTITGLTVGQEYQIEFFVWDGRWVARDREFYLADNMGNSSATNTNYDAISVIGTFTAQATTQNFIEWQDAGAPCMNAYVLRAIGGVKTQLQLSPDPLEMVLNAPAALTTGAVEVAFEYGSNSNNVQVTSAGMIEQQHAGAFSVVGFSPLTLTDPASSETLNVEFDLTGTGLADGETSTGTVEVIWNEIGGETFTNTLAVSAAYNAPAASLALDGPVEMLFDAETSISSDLAVTYTPDSLNPLDGEITAVVFTNTSHSGFSCPTVPPTLTLSQVAPSSTINIAFDNNVAGLLGGGIATATAVVIWNEAGIAENNTNYVAVSAMRVKTNTITVDKNTDPTDSDVLNSNVVVAVNLGTPIDGDGDGNVVGVAVPVTVNGTDFETIASIGDSSTGNFGATDVDETYSKLGIGQLHLTASPVDGYSDFNGLSTSMGGNIESIFKSVCGVPQNNINFAFTDLEAGATYQLQLFFSSAAQPRITEIYQGGNTNALATWSNGTDKETIITLTWTADASGIESFNFAAVEWSEILSGFVYTSTATPSLPPVQIAAGANGDLNISVGGMDGESCTLQGTESLEMPLWYDLATTSGVTEVEWIYTPAKTVEFLRVVSP